MKERFGAMNPDSMRLRFHCQTAAATLTAPQYKINIVRTAMQALSAVLGGAQSLHTNGYDEAFAIPTEDAMKMALRTQQIIAEETNVTSVIDPLGGSYYVEALTTDYERRIFDILKEVEERGGTIKLIEQGWFQKHIADFAYETALRKQSGEKPVIGVNRFVEDEEQHDIEIHPYDPTTAERQVSRTQRVRRERDNAKVNAAARPAGRRGEGRVAEHHADHDRTGEGRRDDGRHRRETEGPVGHVSGDAGVLIHAGAPRATERRAPRVPESILQPTTAPALGAPSPPMPSAPHPNLLSYLGTHPELAGPPRHVGANSAIVGRVTLGRDAWLGAASVIRADGHYVRAGDDLTLGHGATIHIAHDVYPTVIGNGVTVGCNAVIHACEVRDDCIVEDDAVILDGCVIEPGAVIEKGSVVYPRTTLEGGHVYAGRPAKAQRAIGANELAERRQQLARATRRGGGGTRDRLGRRPGTAPDRVRRQHRLAHRADRRRPAHQRLVRLRTRRGGGRDRDPRPHQRAGQLDPALHAGRAPGAGRGHHDRAQRDDGRLHDRQPLPDRHRQRRGARHRGRGRRLPRGRRQHGARAGARRGSPVRWPARPRDRTARRTQARADRAHDRHVLRVRGRARPRAEAGGDAAVSDRLLKFLFKAAPVRGGLVRIEDAWRQMVTLHDYPPVVTRLLGEMVAAGALLATSIKFNGALVMQVHGDGPVKLMVVECLPDLAIRATAKIAGGDIADDATMRDLINRHGRGRFAITLDPRDPMPGQQPYQGIVPLDGESMADVLQAYMRQSEQLDTRLWLAADDRVSAGLLLQSLPSEGGTAATEDTDAWSRAVTLAQTITDDELLKLAPDAVLHRLFWQETLEHYPAMSPHFACTCSRERIGRMLVSLGRDEVDSIIDEQGTVTVTCDFCNRQYTFDAVDATQLFTRGDTAQADEATRH